MNFLFSWLGYGSSIALSAAILLHSPDATAADQVRLEYGAFGRSIAVSELMHFAETGEASRSLQFYLSAGQQNSEDVRRILTQPIEVQQTALDGGLNNPIGGILLDQIGQTIHPPSKRASREALRSAIVLSAEDGNVSLVEVIQNYPTTEVIVEGDRLIQAYRAVSAIAGAVAVRNLGFLGL